MTMTGLDEIVDDYLQRLDTALARLPAAEREQIVAEITEHIAQARANVPSQSEAAVRELLDRLGDPEVIAAAALTDAGAQAVEPRRPVRSRRGAMLVVAGVVVLAFAAVKALNAAGLKAGIAMVPATSYPANVVVSVSPAEGSAVRSGTLVKLAVSQGPSIMPSVIGLDSRAATNDLVGRGLRVVSVRVHGPQTQGTVVAQLPSQGTKLNRQSWVRIDVVNNSRAVPKTVPNVAFVPGGYAIAELRSLGLKVHVRYVTKFPIPNVVVGQTTPGDPVPRTGVYIAISRSSK
jgi:uncharacterized membrane protein